MAWLIILLLCFGNSSARFLDVTNKSNFELEEGVLSLLQRVQLEEFYDTVLIYGNDCVFHTVSRRLNVSTVLVSSGSTKFDWDFGSLTLILSCSPEEEKEATLRTLVKLQRNRRLIYQQRNIQPDSICKSYAEKEQFNIAMVKDDFVTSKVVHACRYFQEPNYAILSLMENKPIYIEQFLNMQGKLIRTAADFLAPRSMLYKDAKSKEMKMMGYVANLIDTFAQKVNATLQLEILSNKFIVREIFKMVERKELDIGTTLDSSLRTKPLDTSSYPYILTSYCLMLQVPAKVPYNAVYAVIMDRLIVGITFIVFCILSTLLIYTWKMSWQDLSVTNILLNDKSIRGMLGQSFPFPNNANNHLRLTVSIIFFASIMITTMYEAYLQSYFTNPPSEPGIESFEDIGRNHRKIAMPEMETKSLIKTNNSYFQEIHQGDLVIFESLPECFKLRDNFNLSYNFAVTGDRWSSYAEQQALFKEPVFYFARNLCFSRMIFLSVPLRPSLPYRHLFEEHIMRQYEFGLVSHWRSHSFFDMVRLGLAPLKDLSQPKVYSPSLLVDDVSWVMKVYLAALMFSVLCFLLEIGVNKWKFRN
ncbi:uncharacterized protein LOC108112080 [Drosophila eugracilis]|uniref:uncharacterized protein LOC108112080 n=1 Tax=Drosophila eugracilis TaxID=29029 RepID=UPI0007E687BC|nr:uncharacterized protein LOC108112080 [Drosophila eugracilis]